MPAPSLSPDMDTNDSNDKFVPDRNNAPSRKPQNPALTSRLPTGCTAFETDKKPRRPPSGPNPISPIPWMLVRTLLLSVGTDRRSTQPFCSLCASAGSTVGDPLQTPVKTSALRLQSLFRVHVVHPTANRRHKNHLKRLSSNKARQFSKTSEPQRAGAFHSPVQSE